MFYLKLSVVRFIGRLRKSIDITPETNYQFSLVNICLVCVKETSMEDVSFAHKNVCFYNY